jgi:hypothetical protein
MISNTGGSEGSCLVILKVNGTEEATREVTIGAGGRETVAFTIAREIEGSYTVSIGDRSGQFVVTAPPVAMPSVQEPARPSIDWGLIAGIAAGGAVLIVVVLYLFVFRHRKRAYQGSIR